MFSQLAYWFLRAATVTLVNRVNPKYLSNKEDWVVLYKRTTTNPTYPQIWL